MSDPGKNYLGQDIAFLIPTKDRPEKVRNLLRSLAQQDIDFRQIIVVASGQNVEGIVMSYSNQLPVEYHHCEPPGQIRQRNMGIQLLDERVRLVGCLDDDIVFQPDALKKMIDFWNQAPKKTAGVGFNVINEKPHHHTWLKGILKLSVPEAGKVLPSGFNTSICNIKETIKTQWLNGGATIWKKEFLKKKKHQVIDSKWAVYEDLIFSFPIGKEYPLHVCANAHVLQEHMIIQNVPENVYRFRGRTKALWKLYFVSSNQELSITAYLWTTILTCFGGILKALLQPERRQLMPEYLGALEGCIIGINVLIQKKDLSQVLSKQTS